MGVKHPEHPIVSQPESVTAYQSVDIPEDTEKNCPTIRVSPITASLAKKLPKNCLTMYVRSDSADRYRIQLYYPLEEEDDDDEPFITQPKQPPTLVLGEMMRDPNTSPEQIWQFIVDYSKHNLKSLARRLLVLKERLGDELFLLILDTTGFEIPWEMMKLSSDHEYLGAFITVTRWHSIAADWDDENEELILEPQVEICQGQVLAYVLGELTQAQSECKFLKGQFQCTPYENINEFHQCLISSQAEYALVYLACHGIFSMNEENDGVDIKNLALGSKENPKQQLRYHSLEAVSLKLLKHSNSIVFLNACHSGRHREDRTYARDKYLRGFAELFLSQGARGVIGTLAPVNDSQAALNAQNLLTAVCQQPTVPIAVHLRQLRAQAAARLPLQPNSNDLLPFLYTFIYVYYGNPLLQLNLLSTDT